MQVSYVGDLCFKLRGNKINVLVGFSPNALKIKPEIMVSTNKVDRSYLANIEPKPFIIDAPGEYEISGVSVFGKGKIYNIEIDDIKIGYLGELAEALTNEQIEEIDGVDLLVIPLGKEGLSISQVVKAIGLIQPKLLIIPAGEQTSSFLKELGQEETKKETRLTVSKTLLPEEMETIILEQNG